MKNLFFSTRLIKTYSLSLAVAFTLLANHTAHAQAWQQALSVSTNQPGNGTSVARATAVNAAGDVFVTGSFSGQIALGNTVLTSAGSNDIFLAKWNTTANTWAWATRGGGTGSDEAKGLVLNGTSLYVVGNFASASSTSIAGTTLAGAGGQDAFVAKFTDNGSAVASGWAVGGGGTGPDYGQGIALNGTSVYATGYFTSATAAQFAGTTLAGAGNTDMFVVKYTDGGSTAANGWAVSGGGTSADYGNGIAASGSSVYVTGSLTSATTARFAGATLAGAGSVDIFLAKYIDAGTTATNGWAVSGGGTSTDIGNGLAVRGTNVFVTGTFISGTTARFAGATLAGTGTANGEMFLARYTDSGTAAVGDWASSGGGTGDDYGNAVAVNGTSIYVAGNFASSTTARIAGATLVGAGSQDVFVAQYIDGATAPTNGWAASGGGPGYDAGYGVSANASAVYPAIWTGTSPASFGTTPAWLVPASAAVLGRLTPTGTWQRAEAPQQGGTSTARATATDAAGNVYVAGYFVGQVSFGNTALLSAGNRDLFLAKWNTATRTWAWAISGGGLGNDEAKSLAVNGPSLYITGSFFSASGARIAGTALAGAGDTDLFVAKFTDNGSTVSSGWATSGGGIYADSGTGVAVNGTSVYATGYFFSASSATIAGTALAGAGDNDIFLAKYTDAGASATNGWVASGGGTRGDIAYGVAVSGSSVYITGSFSVVGNARLSGVILGGAGDSDMFLAKFTDSGTTAANGWALSGGGSNADSGYGVVANGSSVYVTGYLYSASGTTIAGTVLNGAGGQDMFVAKYIDNGSTPANGWATSGGGAGSDIGYGVALSGSNVYVAGSFTSTGSPRIASSTLAGAGDTDLFVANYLDGGSTVTGNGAASGGGAGGDAGFGLTVSGNTVSVVGGTTPRASFGTLVLSAPVNTLSFFVGQLATTGFLATASNSPMADVALYPNPTRTTATVYVPAVAGATQVRATLLNGLGQLVYTRSAPLPVDGINLLLDVAALPRGLYVLRLQAGNAVGNQRLVLE